MKLDAEQITIGTVKCESCGYTFTVAVLPWSPQRAKVECGRCEATFEVDTSAKTSMEAMDDYVGEMKEWDAAKKKNREYSKPPARNNTVFHPVPGTSTKRRKVETEMGDAYLIG